MGKAHSKPNQQSAVVSLSLVCAVHPAAFALVGSLSAAFQHIQHAELAAAPISEIDHSDWLLSLDRGLIMPEAYILNCK